MPYTFEVNTDFKGICSGMRYTIYDTIVFVVDHDLFESHDRSMKFANKDYCDTHNSIIAQKLETEGPQPPLEVFYFSDAQLKEARNLFFGEF